MSSPVRVGQVMGKMVGGGVESVIMNYYHHIDRSRFQFDFLVDEDSTLIPRDEIESLGGRVFIVPPYQRLPLYMRELEQLFHEQAWPIIHSNINALSIFPLAAAKRAGVPVRIAHSHSTSGKGEAAKNAMKAVLRRFSNLYPTHRLACSEYAGKWLFGSHVSFDVVPNAIELDCFSFDPLKRSVLRYSLGVPEDAFLIGHIGRFTSQKNQTFLIRAFKYLAAQMPNAFLVLVGEGSMRNGAESLVKDLNISNRVLFLGQRKDVASLYSALDVFCLPSLYEGLGIVAIEAQKSGLPCLLSEAVPAEADVTGECSYLPIVDPRVWAEALERLRGCSRVPVKQSNFTAYDICSAAPMLLDRYEAMLREVIND